MLGLTIVENISYGCSSHTFTYEDIINAARQAHCYNFIEALPMLVVESLNAARQDNPSRTVIIVAHRLSTIQSYDLICTFGSNERLLKSGTRAELMFQFADRIDILLLILGLCFMLVHVAGVLVNIILFGRITGVFATTSFAVDCHNQYQNFASTIINNTVCPLGIDINPLNYDRLHKLCHYDNKTILSTSAPLTPLFHENVMHLVYWFFGKSVEYDDFN
ncbi:unnamed protein product [Adineta steineri]|uniref:Uncharacterized protein n=1 Tax=Adineta steineri TaxID=433720 RepID=A0A815N3M7_9BILA|nr:unnamed protein product [Adineta steineri]CAF3637558.1 unnamed protein product [Adineta steineri]